MSIDQAQKKTLWINKTVKKIKIQHPLGGIFPWIYSCVVYSADENLGRESKDLAPAQICANHDMVYRAFEKLGRSGSATVS